MAELEDPTDTYEELEQSTQEALAIEYYLFQIGKTKYHYTTGEFETTFLGEKWEPLQITRGITKTGSIESSRFSLSVKLPSNCDFIQKFAYVTGRPEIELIIYRNFIGALETEAIILWSGFVTDFSASKRTTTLTVPSKLSSYLKDEVPSVYYHSICNHVLYDSRCKVKKSAHSFNIVPKKIEGTLISFTSSSFIGFDALLGGFLRNTLNNENRTIMTNTDKTLEVNYPFYDLLIDTPCVAYSGCDHSKETCKKKFNNYENFGGHTTVPTENPFIGDID